MNKTKPDDAKTYNDFWLKDDLVDQYIPEPKKGKDDATFSLDLIQLASYRRVISNFVSILTNKNIPVQFFSSDRERGFTDGETVWLSASVKKKKDFDWTVGLALHEGSHIKLSDFKVLKTMFLTVPIPLPQNIKDKGKAKNLSNEQLAYLCKWIFNFVEDRYVDSFIYHEAPGYRGYYQSMYNKLWNSDEVSKVLESKMYRKPTLRAFEYRVIYLTNPSTDLDALPGLRDIAKLVNISDIFRLKTTQDRMDLAIKVLEVIIDNLNKQVAQKNPNSAKATIKTVHQKLTGQNDNPFFVIPDESPSDEDDGEDGNQPIDGKGKPTDEIGDIQEKIEQLDDSKNDGVVEDSNEEEGDTSDFSKAQLKKIRDNFDKQKNILKHDYDSIKEEVSKGEQAILDVIEKAGIILVPTGFGMGNSNPGDFEKASVDCILVQKLTMDLIESGRNIFPMAAVEHAPGGDFTPPQKYEDAVSNGFVLGRLLGKKLQVRGETNIVKFIRKVSGKIERRLLHGIGAGLEDVFNKIHIEKFNRARLHISVDASSSMDTDDKWLPTMTCLVAVCVAASMVENLSVSVSFRCTHRLSDGTYLPYVVLAYDSDKDKIQKVRRLFPYLKPNGGTPEGLVFEAIMEKFIIGKKSDEQDHYFVNISDGEPCYILISPSNYRESMDYNGEGATIHTKKQVDKIRAQGVNVLSYFIKSDDSIDNLYGYNPFVKNPLAPKIPYKDTLKSQFERMYGKDAKFIDVTNVFDIAKTMNQLFLTKE